VSLKGCSLFLRLYRGRSRGKKGGFEDVGWREGQPREYAVRKMSGFLPLARYKGGNPYWSVGDVMYRILLRICNGDRGRRVYCGEVGRNRTGNLNARHLISNHQRWCRRCSKPRQGGYADPSTGCCESWEPSPGVRAKAPRTACRSIRTRQASTRNPLSVLLLALLEGALAISRLVCLRRPSESAEPTRPSSQAGAGCLGNISFDTAQDAPDLRGSRWLWRTGLAPRRGR
jgi:hypothetical protein